MKNDMYPFTCEGLERKASIMFDPNDPTSCVSQVCAQPKASCNLGLAVHGFSQGANLISLAKYYDPLVSAAFEQGNGNAAIPPPDDMSRCMNYYQPDGSRNPLKALSSSQTRSVVGQNDEFFGCCYECPCNDCCDRTTGHVYVQQVQTTGVNCSEGTFDCLDAEGSGWYVVSKAQSGKPDGADHCFAYEFAECLTRKPLINNWNPNYVQNCTWCLQNNLQWLAKTALAFGSERIAEPL